MINKRLERALELRRRDAHILSAEEAFELLYMLPDPDSPQKEDGSGLAQTLFKFTCQDEGLDLDQLMMILNEQARTYLLENGYVKEISHTDQYGKFYRYGWADIVGTWDSFFES